MRALVIAMTLMGATAWGQLSAGWAIAGGASPQPSSPQPSSPQPADKPDKSDKRTAVRPSDDDVLSQLGMLWPDKEQALRQMRGRDGREAREFRNALQRVRAALEQCDHLRRGGQPELADLAWESFQLQEECRDLASSYRVAPDEPTRLELAGRLRNKVAEQLDIEHRRRAVELDKMQARLIQMQEELARQAHQRDKTVHDRLRQWLGGKVPAKLEPLPPSGEARDMATPPSPHRPKAATP